MSKNKNKCDNVIFIRHKLDGADEVGLCEKLYNEKKIAYHYIGETHEVCRDIYKKEYSTKLSLLEKQYKAKTIKNAYKAAVLFEDAIKNKKLVIAEYTFENGKKEYLLGRVVGKKIEDIEYKNSNNFYKTLQLEDSPIKFSVEEFPVYLAVRPPFITLCEYGGRGSSEEITENNDDIKLRNNPFFVKIIPIIYKHKKNISVDEKIEFDVHLLHHSMIEQMCEEYLRLHGYDEKEATQLQYNSCRVGKSMEKYDIVGRAKNNVMIYAQVKADWKESYVNIFEDVEFPKEEKAEMILFASENGKNVELNNGAKFVSIQDVFKYFNNDVGQKMLMDMSGLSEEYQCYLEFK